MSQWVNALASKPDDLSSISGNPIEEVDNWPHKFSQASFLREREKRGGNLNKPKRKQNAVNFKSCSTSFFYIFQSQKFLLSQDGSTVNNSAMV